MHIITISREFGSGGRELGKRLAEALGYAYYDREILTMLAERTDLDEAYLAHTLEETRRRRCFRSRSGRRFRCCRNYQAEYSTQLLAKANGADQGAGDEERLWIVGRNGYHPAGAGSAAAFCARGYGGADRALPSPRGVGRRFHGQGI